ncbi:SAM-dependent methyltransferase [Streptomyces sp. NPDC020719]|uniref:SAM-dependent methyltransferase n=1 Tax=Streptomyces sp. NPDC020719 TaxID=3154896 RepID=UPI0033C6918D
MTTPDAISPVSRTALTVAAVRARESERPDKLFDDPYAAAFRSAADLPAFGPGRRFGAGERGCGASSCKAEEGGDAERRQPTTTPQMGVPHPHVPGKIHRTGPSPLAVGFAHHAVIRTRFYDDALLAACDAGIRQVVLLAAGLDSRAFRLPWPPDTSVYELDLPPILTFKEGVLDSRTAVARCARTVLPVDLLDGAWAETLREAGFDPAAPTAWLVEGLLVYLTADEAAGVLGVVGELSAPGSRIAMERGSGTVVRPDGPELARITELWKGGLGGATVDWLREHGWAVDEYELRELSERYGRPVANPLPTGFLSARRAG